MQFSHTHKSIVSYLNVELYLYQYADKNTLSYNYLTSTNVTKKCASVYTDESSKSVFNKDGFSLKTLILPPALLIPHLNRSHHHEQPQHYINAGMEQRSSQRLNNSLASAELPLIIYVHCTSWVAAARGSQVPP